MEPFRTHSRRRPARLRALLLPLLALASLLLVPLASAGQGLAVTGVVLDERDRPLSGAEVTLHAVSSGPQRGALLLAGEAHPEPAVRARTDGEGRFRLDAPEAGFWSLVVRHRGRLPAEHQLHPLLAPVELSPAVLLPAELLVVQVVDEKGAPLAGVPVLFQGQGPSRQTRHWRPWRWGQPPHRVALTGPKGRAVLRRLEGETGTVHAAAPGRAAEAEISGGDAQAPVRLALMPEPARVLRAVAPEKAPAAGVVVWSESLLPAGRTGEDGTLAVPLGARGSASVRLEAPDGRMARAVLTRPGDDETGPVEVSLAPAPRVTGRVVEARSGAGIAGAWVWPVLDPGAAVRTVEGGAFQIPLPWPDGTVALAAAALGHLPSASAPVDVSVRPETSPVLRLEPAAHLAGRVVDGGGRPLAGAAVRVVPVSSDPFPFRPGQEDHTTRSGDDGRFRLDGLPRDGALSVRVSLRGYAPREERVALETALAGEAGGGPAGFPEIEVVLARGARLRGRLVEESGAPVAGAEVVLVPKDAPRDSWAPEPEGTTRAETGPDGTFEIVDLPAGRVDLGVTASGHPPLVIPGVEVPPPPASVELGDLVLDPEAVLEGVVEDPRGSPVAGARVQVETVAPHRVRYPLARDEAGEPPATGVDGRFQFGGLRPGDLVEVRVWKQGFAAGGAAGVRVPAEEEVRIVLEPAAQVTGRVVDEAGRAVEHSHVFPSGPSSQPWDLAAPVEVAEDGTFVAELPPGEVHLQASARGHEQSAPVRLELTAGERREGVELVLRPTAVVRGRVFSPEGEPAAGAQVGATIVHPEGSSSTSVLSAVDGRFEIEVRPGPILLEASKEGWASATEELHLPPEGASVDLHLGRGGRVSGRVVSPGGEPAAGHRVRLVSHAPVFRFPAGQVTAADGTFVFEGVADGSYQIQVAEDVRRGRSGRPDHIHPEEVVVTGGLPVSGITIRLPWQATLHGRMVGVTEAELPRLTVRAIREGERFPRGRAGTALAGGTYEVTGLDPGRWQVSAAVSGSGKTGHGTVEIAPGQEEARLDLELREGLTIAGTVRWNGQAAPGVQVSGAGVAQGAGVGTVSGPDGRFELAGLAPGRQEIRLFLPRTGISASRTVEVSGGEDLVLEIETGRVRGSVLSAVGMAPVAEALVTLQAPGIAAWHMSPRTRTAGDGVFLLDGVEVGAYELRIETPGFGAVSLPVTVTAGEVALPPVVLEPE